MRWENDARKRQTIGGPHKVPSTVDFRTPGGSGIIYLKYYRSSVLSHSNFLLYLSDDVGWDTNGMLFHFQGGKEGRKEGRERIGGTHIRATVWYGMIHGKHVKVLQID